MYSNLFEIEHKNVDSILEKLLHAQISSNNTITLSPEEIESAVITYKAMKELTKLQDEKRVELLNTYRHLPDTHKFGPGTKYSFTSGAAIGKMRLGIVLK